MPTMPSRRILPVCVLICLLSFVVEGCKQMHFKITVKGEALVNHTFLTDRATDDGHCRIKCFLDDRCISYNFGRSVSGELSMCELNEADHVMYPDDLIPRPNTTYRMAENTCNCSKFELCRPQFESNTHRCECNTGYTLEKCDANFQTKNCKGFEDQREVFELDAGDSSALAKHSICRMVLNTSNSSKAKSYRLTVDLFTSRPDKSNLMHPGIGFNVEDQDNFDYIFFSCLSCSTGKIRRMNTINNCRERTHKTVKNCVQPGYVRRNVRTHGFPSCRIEPPPGYAWFRVAVEVTHSSATVYVNGTLAMQIKPSFPLKQRGALVLVNGYKNLLQFKNYLISQI